MSKFFEIKCKCGRVHVVFVNDEGNLEYKTLEPAKKRDSIEALLEDEESDDGEET